MSRLRFCVLSDLYSLYQNQPHHKKRSATFCHNEGHTCTESCLMAGWSAMGPWERQICFAMTLMMVFWIRAAAAGRTAGGESQSPLWVKCGHVGAEDMQPTVYRGKRESDSVVNISTSQHHTGWSVRELPPPPLPEEALPCWQMYRFRVLQRWSFQLKALDACSSTQFPKLDRDREHGGRFYREWG